MRLKPLKNLHFMLLLCILAVLPLAHQPALAQPAQQPHPDVTALIDQADDTWKGNLDAGLKLYNEALLKARALRDKAGAARALTNMATALHESGQQPRALELYKQAVPLWEEAGDKAGLAETLKSIGSIYVWDVNKPQEALPFLNRALPLLREVGDKSLLADVLVGLHDVYADAQPQKAMEMMTQTLPLYREVGDKENVAHALKGIGEGYLWRLNKPREALPFFNEVLPLLRELENKTGEAEVLVGLHDIYESEQPQKALEMLQQALSLQRQAKNKKGEADVLRKLGFSHLWSRGKPQESLPFLHQALPLFREIGDKGGQGGTLLALGEAHRSLNQTDKALEYLNQSLPLLQEAGDKDNETTALKSIGEIYQDTERPQQALDVFNQALTRFRQAGAKEQEGRMLTSIGGVLRGAGNPQDALAVLNQALSLHRTIGDKKGQAESLQEIGALHLAAGEHQRALEALQQALPLWKETGDNWHIETTLNGIGAAFNALGQPQKALEVLKQARALQKGGEANPVAVAPGEGKNINTGSEAQTLSSIGAAYSSNNQPQEALTVLAEALQMSREAGNKAVEAGTLSNIAAVEESQGQLDEAAAHMSQALSLVEEMRESLGASSTAKVAFLQSNLFQYHAYVNLLLKQKKEAEAFAWAQKTKARSLLDLMAGGKVNLSRGVSDREAQRERELKWKLGQLNRKLISEAIGTDPNAARIESLKRETTQTEAALETFTDALYVKYPELARKRVAQTVSLQDVAKFLPPDTALLEYVVLKARSTDQTVLFCVTVEGGQARVAVYRIALTRKQLSERLADFRTACSQPGSSYEEKARALYDVLIAPAARQLQGRKRLVICPDGPLWEAPFQALMARSEATGDAQFLIERHEVSYAYSATAMQSALLVKRDAGTAKPARTLLALANPSFGGAERAAGSVAGGKERPIIANLRPIITNLREIGTGFVRGDGSIAPLPGTQLEADAIKSSFPDAVISTGEKAQEATAKEQGGRFRYLHFATHGVLNDASPLESSIVLAQPLAGAKEDGFLTAREIFDLDLPAEMVVLSACNTARGDQRSGEGVVGLSWALFVAGAPTQVLSQWAVADASTAQLMKSFYTNLKAGNAKGETLRAASLSLMQDGQHAHPFYWAPFVLLGDWR